MRLPRKDLGLEKDEPTQALQKGVPAADSTLRLKRDEMSFEEPTVALKASVPAADATVRLKRDEMSFEEPTVALKAGVPAADATVRLKRDEMSLEEPTQALERPKLRTAMEVIDEATQVEPPQAKPSVMMPDGTDIPSWEETTQFYTPPGGHSETTTKLSRSLEPPPAPVDPSDSMDDTFSNVPIPVLPLAKMPVPAEAPGLMLVSEIAETEEDTLVLPDMHELDELPNAMKATSVMPVLEAPETQEELEPMVATPILQSEPSSEAAQAPEIMEKTIILHVEPPPAPMEKTMVLPAMEAPAAAQAPEPMEKTVVLQVEPPPAPLEKTMLMPGMEAPAAAEAPEPMEKTVVLHVEPPPAPMEKTMVMPAMETTAAVQAPELMEATAIMPISVSDPSAYLTRQGQSPWSPSSDSLDTSTVSTQFMSDSLLSKAKEATSLNADSALAPVPPEVTAMEDDSPLAKATDITAAPHPMHPLSPAPDRTVDTSIGMVVTPSTLLMPIQPPLDKTVPIERPTPASTPPAAPGGLRPMPKASQPMPSRPVSKPVETKPSVSRAAVAPPSVPGYPDRQIPAPQPPAPQPPATKFQTKPIPSPVRLPSPAPIPRVPKVTPADSSSKAWIPVAIGLLLLVIGGIYFAFFRTSLKTNTPLVALPGQTAEPSLPVAADMQGTLAQAKAGDSKAMHMLGVSFYYGLNVPQNKAEGLRWMRKAAEAGNEKAKSDLRQMESRGR